MFENNSTFNHQSVFNFKTSKLTDASNMFKGTTSFSVTGGAEADDLNKKFLKNIGKHNSVTTINLSGMFDGSGYNRVVTIPPTITKVTNTSKMFANSDYNSEIKINTRNVTDMSGMFQNNDSFNQNIENWNVNKVTNFSEMFKDNTAFDQAIAWGTKIHEDAILTEMFANTIINNSSLLSFNHKIKNREGYATMFRGNETVAPENLHTAYKNRQPDDSDGSQGPGGEDSDSGNFKPANKAALVEAVQQWCTNVNYALSVYGDINTWDVSGITDMSGLFESQTEFNSEIGNWDVSNVLTMENMFRSARTFNQDIGQWDVGQVKNMEKMFLNAALFNKDIGNWSTDNVTNMADMFNGTRVFNQDIGQWNVSSVTTMANMFYNAIAFNQDISGWTLSSLENTSGMFLHAFSFNQDIGDWDISKIQYANGMFTGVTLSIANYDALLIGWSTKTNTEGDIPTGIAFHGGNSCYSAAGESAKLKLTNTHEWDIEDGGLAFKPENNADLAQAVKEWCDNSTTATETYGDINTWDVSEITDMNWLFLGKWKIYDLDISNWDTSSVQFMESMFRNMSNLQTLTLNPDFVTSSVKNMGSMFSGCTKLTTITGISEWDTSTVSNMSATFDNCVKLETLDIQNWDISSVSNMAKIFNGVTLNTATYDAILVGWSTQTNTESNIPTNITFDAGNSRYASLGSSAKNTLIESYNWKITDGGSVNRIELIIDKNLRSAIGSYVIDLAFSTVEDGNFVSMSAVPIDDEGNEVTFDTDTEYGRAQAWEMNALITTDVGNYAPNPDTSREWTGINPTAFSTNAYTKMVGGRDFQYNIKYTLSGDFTTFRVRKPYNQTNPITEIKVIGCPNYNLRSWEESANSGYKPALAEDQNLGITKIDLSEYTGQVTDAKNLMTYQDKLAYIDIRNVDFSLCTNFENAFNNVGSMLGNDVEKTYLGFNDIDFSSIPPKNSQDSTVKYGVYDLSPISNIFYNSTVASAICYGNGTSLYAQGVKFENLPANFPHLSASCLPNGWEVV